MTSRLILFSVAIALASTMSASWSSPPELSVNPCIVEAVHEFKGAARHLSLSRDFPTHTTYGKNAEIKFRKHVEQIRRTTGHSIGKLSTDAGKAELMAAIDDVVMNGETRQIPWTPYPDALWTRKGKAIVIRRPNGEFVTFLEADKGGALRWNQH